MLATTWTFRLNIKGSLIAVNVKVGSPIVISISPERSPDIVEHDDGEGR